MNRRIAATLAGASMAAVLASGCAPIRNEAPPELVPLGAPGAPARVLPTETDLAPATTTTTTVSQQIVLQQIPAPDSPEYLQMTPEEFFALFGFWPEEASWVTLAPGVELELLP